MSLRHITDGFQPTVYLNNPFTRFHESLEDNPHFFDDIDDLPLYGNTDFERMRKFEPPKDAVVGDTTAIPPEENDEKLVFYDIQGESVYTNPPDSNIPVVDHRLDEEFVWAFNRTPYNQYVIRNQYLKNPMKQMQRFQLPFWSKKLQAPAFYSDEKFQRMLRQ